MQKILPENPAWKCNIFKPMVILINIQKLRMWK